MNFLSAAKKRFKNFIKLSIKRINLFLRSVFRRLPLRDRVFFYTIRADGKLLENSKVLFDALDTKKIICAHTLPHSVFIKPVIYYRLLTNKVIVTDDYVRYLRNLKLRDGQKVVQIWHAGGAFKRFGLDAPSQLTRREEIATHSQYDLVTVTSEHCRKFYAQAFGIDIEKVKALGMPRTDALLNKAALDDMRKNIYGRHPELKGKKIYSYFPTFREIKGKRVPFDPEINWAELNAFLKDDEVFVIHKHPVMNEELLKDGSCDKIINLNSDPTPEILSVSDILITDYSSVIFDASLMNVPTVFYCPDFDRYERSFYVDYPEDLPGPVVYDQAELSALLRAGVDDTLKSKAIDFREKFMSACDGHSTERIANEIKKLL
ncbi:MAG: CDP-glycerol glycerophosphotransferase family protein [Clostridiales bacterium]|nr:CDP-glycerol glycerophosphotransferase family protein [Clostridiales bacterium]